MPDTGKRLESVTAEEDPLSLSNLHNMMDEIPRSRIVAHIPDPPEPRTCEPEPYMPDC